MRSDVHGVPLEVVGTVLEMADLAWNALEHRRERKIDSSDDEELAQLRAENHRLRSVLSENLALLQAISLSPSLSGDCPPNLYTRLLDAVNSSSLLTKLESQHAEVSVAQNDIMINIDHEEPSWWVWVSQEILPKDIEEVSGIDSENYMVISEDDIVDAVSCFIAECILSNPKAKGLTQEELRRTITKALGGINGESKWRKVWEAAKVIYTLSTWGVCLAGLYRHRAVLKVAAKGVHATSKIILKAL